MFDVLRILSHIRQYRARETWARERLDALQRRRLAALVRHARTRSPWYRRALAHVDPDRCTLQDLPVMDKDTLMAHWDEVVCDPRLRLEEVRAHVDDPSRAGRRYRGHVVIVTSGTSGRPAVMLYDREAFLHVRALSLARGIRVDTTPRRLLRCLGGDRLRIACVLLDRGFAPAASNFRHVPAATGVFLDVMPLSLREPLPVLVERLQAFRPQVLVAYPSVLERLAEEQLAGRLRILVDERETWIASVSEPLEPWLRARLKAAFQVRIQDLYGTGECLPLARSCAAEQGLHLNLDAACYEVVDRDLRPVPPGEYGAKVLVTNLFNRVLPIVRYVVTDIVAVDPAPCPCGATLPRVVSVRGRSDQVLTVRGPSGPVELHPYPIMEAFLSVPGLADWQVVQVAPDRLRVDVLLDGGEGVGVGRVLEAALADLGLAGHVTAEVRPVPHLVPDGVSGKVKRFRVEAGS